MLLVDGLEDLELRTPNLFAQNVNQGSQQLKVFAFELVVSSLRLVTPKSASNVVQSST